MLDRLKRSSVRLRLTALFVAIFGTTLVIFSIVLYQVFVRAHQNEFDVALYNHAVDVTEQIEIDLFGELSLQTNPLSTRGKLFPFTTGRAFWQIQTLQGTVVDRSPTLGRSQLPFGIEDLELLLHEGHGAIFRTMSAKQLPQFPNERTSSYRVIIYLIKKPHLPRLILQIAVPMTFIENERNGILTFFLISIPLTLVLATFGGLYLSRRALLPIRRIIEKARTIGATELSMRVPVPGANDELRSLAVTINDLLNRLQLAFESQERFIADASHQLKTPLSIIRGELDVMRSRDRSPAEISEFLSSASQEINHLSKLVEDLLLLARMDAGYGSLAIQEVRLDEVAIEAVARLEPFARRKHVTLRLNLSSDDDSVTDYRTQGDPDLIQALLHNLVENAIKYSPDGQPVEVMLRESGGDLVVSIADRGPGIPPAQVANIFNRFYRVEGERNLVPGTGLGLPIARRIAEVHGANLEVDSRPGGGSVFTFRIKKF